MLLKDYYNILGRESREGYEFFRVSLNPQSRIYDGHFPGEPVSPGVCGIQIILECAEESIGRKLRLTHIKQCRMTQLITPELYPQLDVYLKLQKVDAESGVSALDAYIGISNDVFLALKGVVKV